MGPETQKEIWISFCAWRHLPCKLQRLTNLQISPSPAPSVIVIRILFSSSCSESLYCQDCSPLLQTGKETKLFWSSLIHAYIVYLCFREDEFHESSRIRSDTLNVTVRRFSFYLHCFYIYIYIGNSTSHSSGSLSAQKTAIHGEMLQIQQRGVTWISYTLRICTWRARKCHWKIVNEN
jgi:hypothetical protein